MSRRRVRTPMEQFQPFERIVGLLEAGWIYRRIAVHVGRCFQQLSLEHSHTRREGSGPPRSADALQ